MLLSLAAGGSIYFAFYMLYQPVKVLVPRRTIEAKQYISENDIAYATFSRKDVHPHAVTDPRAVIGKFTETTLYEREQILSDRLVDNPDAVTGAFRFLKPDETFITFSSSEASWPVGLRKGDMVTALVILETGPKTVGENLRVLNISDKSSVLDKVSGVVQNSAAITIACSREQAKYILDGKVKGKLLYFMPEHPEFKSSEAKGGVDSGRPEQAEQSGETGQAKSAG